METCVIFIFACKFWTSPGLVKYLCTTMILLQLFCSVDIKRIFNFFFQINCYSLNSIGPTVEKLSGPRRYMAIYVISAVAGKCLYLDNVPFCLHCIVNFTVIWWSCYCELGSTMSYWFCKAPAVGASGAIFGLVSCLHPYNPAFCNLSCF